MKIALSVFMYLSMTTIYVQDQNSFLLTEKGTARVFYGEKELVSTKDNSTLISINNNHIVFTIDDRIIKIVIDRDIKRNPKPVDQLGIGILYHLVTIDVNQEIIEFVFSNKEDSDRLFANLSGP